MKAMRYELQLLQARTAHVALEIEAQNSAARGRQAARWAEQLTASVQGLESAPRTEVGGRRLVLVDEETVVAAASAARAAHTALQDAVRSDGMVENVQREHQKEGLS